MAIVHDFPTERQVPPSPSLLHQLKASQEARVIGIRLHSADRQLQRAPDCEWSGLTLHEKGAYDTKGAIALNLGDHAALDRALEDMALTLRCRFPHVLITIEVARAVAAAGVATWITSMAGMKGRRL